MNTYLKANHILSVTIIVRFLSNRVTRLLRMIELNNAIDQKSMLRLLLWKVCVTSLRLRSETLTVCH